jgi:hypothetical protein
MPCKTSDKMRNRNARLRTAAIGASEIFARARTRSRGASPACGCLIIINELPDFDSAESVGGPLAAAGKELLGPHPLGGFSISTVD